ncbi:MAG: P-II family nitrogen regulator [Thermoflexales bacterium]
MRAIKRIEIVTDALEIERVAQVLEQHGVSGYTIVPHVVGKGERGIRRGDELSGVFKNSYLLTTCDESQLPALIEAIRPILRQRGGICLVSDAWWVQH